MATRYAHFILLVFISFIWETIAFNSGLLNATDGSVLQRRDNSTSPPFSTDHGNPNLICAPGTWERILVFFAGNYLSHAATTVSLPGQSMLSTILTICGSMLFPTSGVIVGIRAIRSWAKFAPTELEMAARAGAFCTIVKEPETLKGNESAGSYPGRVESNDDLLSCQTHQSEGYQMQRSVDHDIRDGRIEDESFEMKSTCAADLTNKDFEKSSVDLESRDPNPYENDQTGRILLLHTAIHGRYRVPPGYLLVLPISLLTPPNRPDTKITYNYNVLKIIASIGQICFGSYTLYNTKGDQLKRYGDIAFGLTVVPYSFMSLVNLLGNLCCPNYPAIYLVDSEALANLRKESPDDYGGVVGTLDEESERVLMESLTKTSEKKVWITDGPGGTELVITLLLCGLILLSVVGGLTGFRPGTARAEMKPQWMFGRYPHFSAIRFWFFFGVTMAPAWVILVESLELRIVLNVRFGLRGRRLVFTVVWRLLIFGGGICIALLGYYAVAIEIAEFGIRITKP